MNILVVDDEPAIVRLVERLLGAMGHRIQSYSLPLEAAKVVSKEIDLIISDINMPDMDGFALAEHTCRALGPSRPRVLLMSGEDHRGRLAGAAPDVVGMLQKPFDCTTLKAAVAALDTASPSAREMLANAPWIKRPQQEKAAP